MNTRKTDNTAPFQTIAAASRITGLSQTFLRSGVREGRIPHIRAGTVYMVNIPTLLAQLQTEAAANGGGMPE